jgi:very-short-patch-repair endonuclease
MSNIEKFKHIVKESNGTGEICRKYNFCDNGKSRNQIKLKINEFKLDISHFGLKNYLCKYQKIKKECPVCQSKFETEKNHPREKKTCSRKCANKFFATFLSLEQKEKIKCGLKLYYQSDRGLNTILKKKQSIVIDKKCKTCQKQFKPKSNKTLYCSKLCQHACLEFKEKLRQVQLKRIANGTHSGWKSRNNPSYAELFFMNVLTNNNIPYKFEEPCGKYFIDFAIESKRIALEIDGKQHLQEDRKKSDQIKDEYLKSQEYYVYRIPWKSINTKSGKEFIENEINKFLEFYNSF